MKTYKVIASRVDYLCAFVEAENEEEAWAKAYFLDVTEFEDSGFGNWEIYSVDEFKEKSNENERVHLNLGERQ